MHIYDYSMTHALYITALLAKQIQPCSSWIELEIISDIARHLPDLGTVEGLNGFQCSCLFTGDEVDGEPFATKPSTATNPAVGKYKTIVSHDSVPQWGKCLTSIQKGLLAIAHTNINHKT